MRIYSAIIEVLAKAEVSGNTLRLTEQLDRKTYQQVSKVLSAIGGKWNSPKKCHIFADDVEKIFGKRQWVSRSQEILEETNSKAESSPATENTKSSEETKNTEDTGNSITPSSTDDQNQ